jgi:hypothetical protein
LFHPSSGLHFDIAKQAGIGRQYTYSTIQGKCTRTGKSTARCSFCVCLPVTWNVIQEEHQMKWMKKHYKTVLLWLLILAVAPLFVEILFVANIVGAELAVGFLLLVIKNIYENWQYRAQRIKGYLSDVNQIIHNQPIWQINIYIFHVTASVVVLFFSGSMVYSVLVWYPVVLFGNQLS